MSNRLDNMSTGFLKSRRVCFDPPTRSASATLSLKLRKCELMDNRASKYRRLRHQMQSTDYQCEHSLSRPVLPSFAAARFDSARSMNNDTHEFGSRRKANAVDSPNIRGDNDASSGPPVSSTRPLVLRHSLFSVHNECQDSPFSENFSGSSWNSRALFSRNPDKHLKRLQVAKKTRLQT